jgi:hypothetical protein
MVALCTWAEYNGDIDMYLYQRRTVHLMADRKQKEKERERERERGRKGPGTRCLKGPTPSYLLPPARSTS